MNPFDSNPSNIDIKDDPDGARVQLECYKCGEINVEGKYWPELELLSWKCAYCGHISKQRMTLSE